MASKIKVDQLETADGSGTIALQNQLSGMTTASLPTVTTDKLGTGAVLQVVYGSSTTQTTSSSSSYVTTGITATITPTSTSSKILVLTKMTARGTTSTDVNTKIYKNSSAIPGMASTKYNNQSSEPSDLVDTYLDSPNTTSATTYTLYAQSSVNGQAITMKAGNTRGSITVMEIAG